MGVEGLIQHGQQLRELRDQHDHRDLKKADDLKVADTDNTEDNNEVERYGLGSVRTYLRNLMKTNSCDASQKQKVDTGKRMMRMNMTTKQNTLATKGFFRVGMMAFSPLLHFFPPRR